MGIRTLVGRSISEVPLTQRMNSAERFFVWSFVEQLTPEGALSADAAGVTLTVLPVDDGLAIEAARSASTFSANSGLTGSADLSIPDANAL